MYEKDDQDIEEEELKILASYICIHAYKILQVCSKLQTCPNCKLPSLVTGVSLSVDVEELKFLTFPIYAIIRSVMAKSSFGLEGKMLVYK